MLAHSQSQGSVHSMKRPTVGLTIALSLLALTSAQATEPSFQRLDLRSNQTGYNQSGLKPAVVEPVRAPSRTVLSASVQPDGSLAHVFEAERVFGVSITTSSIGSSTTPFRSRTIAAGFETSIS